MSAWEALWDRSGVRLVRVGCGAVLAGIVLATASGCAAVAAARAGAVLGVRGPP